MASYRSASSPRSSCMPKSSTKLSPPSSTVSARLERIFQKARDVSNIPRGTKQEPGAAASPPVSEAHQLESHPTAPDGPRSLRRTTSSASLDTIRASSVRTVRRRIKGNPKQNPKTKASPNRKNENATETSPLEHASDTRNQDPTSPSRSKTTKHRRRPVGSARPLQDAQDQFEEDDISAITARLLQIAPTAAWALQPSLLASLADLNDAELCESHGTLSKDTETATQLSGNHERNHELPIRSLRPGSHIVEDLESVTPLQRIATHDIKDLQLVIRPYESNVTVWDESHNGHYPLKCQLLLKCHAQGPFDILSLPDVRRIEFVCSTLPVEGHYAVRPPSLLQTTYKGARIDTCTSFDEAIVLNAADGVHIEKTWRSTMGEDGVWGWYVPVFTPVSMRLFDKMEYRKFRLMGKLWMGDGDGGEKLVETELTVGMSVLLRELDMK
ncbi:hypothetical protein BS17DRAFT_581734 [Gyrodon lividus]|nr:hypothetical protein BS17DRAFT_581734 [Gyrodon lividus]